MLYYNQHFYSLSPPYLYLDGDINPKPFIVKQISADSPNVSRDILSTDSDSGKNVNPNLFVLHVPVPMNIPLPVTPSVASMPQTSANPVASGQHNTPSNGKVMGKWLYNIKSYSY